ncbi:beta-lactamase-like protein [Scheffersomyces xylosifermentans]|uniref:beta-lactamase-like protein n=1 Tax=Scheffersomyces xylosifermentans TaxID=1304137 RepID=UPI00315D3965
MFTFSLITPGKEDFSFRAALLSFDNEFKILADPSWNGKDVSSVLFMEQYLRETNIILLSHSTPEFLSGYVLLCLKFPHLMANIQVYSTLPVNQLGRLSTVEFYRANGILGPLDTALLELDEVDEWFDKVNSVKYLQAVNVFENKVVITPYNAGHTLGGTFWLITKRIDRVIYAPAWNHSKDSFLNSASFLSTSNGNPLSSLLRPTAFITSTDMGSTMSHKKRTEKFLQLVDATLANGGAALIPTSLSGRFLELFHLIDEHLQGAPIPIYFLSYSGTKVLSYASNLIDWMSPNVTSEWEEAENSSIHKSVPFDPSKVDLLLDANELIQLSGPKIVFCSGIDLKNGELSAEAFQYLCQDEKSTILLTEKSFFGVDDTLNSILYKEWHTLAKKKLNGKVEDGVAVPLERVFSIDDWTREESLVGRELTDFQERIALHRKEKLLAKVKDRKTQNLLNSDLVDAEDSSDDEEEEESGDEQSKTVEPTETAVITATVTTGPSIADELAAHEAFISDHIKQSLEENRPLDLKITHKLKPRQAMFPYFINLHKHKFDDYGAVVDIKDFQRTDEMTNNKIILEGKKKFEQNDRRRWNDDNDRRGQGQNGARGKNQTRNQINKLTPQEQLNNQILEKHLDTLFTPRKRVPLGAASSYSTTKQQLRVRCGLSFVDLSGLVDLRSLSIIVSSLKPYNLLLLPDLTTNETSNPELNGLLNVRSFFENQQVEQKQEENKKNLFNSTRYLSLSTIRSGLSSVVSYGSNNKMNVLSVTNDESIKIGTDNDAGGVGLNNFEINLDDNIIDDLKWQSIDGSYRVAQVYGELEIYNQGSSAKRSRDLNDYINPSTLFTLKKVKKEDFAKRQLAVADRTTSSSLQPLTGNGPKLAIGNIKLPDLKKKLVGRNLNAEFKSEGTLVVNDKIAIRKVAYGSVEGDDTGDIVIDGNAGPLYYEVKECIREMLAYV